MVPDSIISRTSQNGALHDFGGSRLITAAASLGLAVGSLQADQAEASPAHRSTDPEPPMLASLHCKHPGVRSESYNGLATVQAQTELRAYWI